ncbi:MAG: hypothetical protein WCI01_09970 [Chlorobiaceae bacterium]
MSETDETKIIETVVIDPAIDPTDGVIDAAPAETSEVEETLTITLGDENEEPEEEADDLPAETEADEHAPNWVKETRSRNKELNKTVKDLQRQLNEAKAAVSAPAPTPAPALPEKPTLDECGYDVDEFEEKLLAWNEAKTQVVARQKAAQAEEEELQTAFQTKVTVYNTRKAALKVSDFPMAEAAVKASLDPVRQGIMVDIIDDPATMVYALYKNPTKMKELAAIQNPLQFAKALTLLETKIKVASKAIKPKVPNDVPVKGSSGVQNDARLDQLRAEADKTGDRSKVAAYIRAKAKK